MTINALTYEDWCQKALGHEQALELPLAFEAYEHALALKPDGYDLIEPLAKLAFRLGQWETARSFYAIWLALDAQSLPAIDGMAQTLRELGLYDKAIGILQEALGQTPDAASLWQTLGSVVAARGDFTNAILFYQESLRLDDNPKARFLLGCAFIEQGQPHRALSILQSCLEAFESPENRDSVAITYAQALLATGDLTQGWPHFLKARQRAGSLDEMIIEGCGPRLTPNDNHNKRIIIMCEQGLGDEIMLVSMINDIKDRFGYCEITVACEPRLVALFQRSFPNLVLKAHQTQRRDGRIYRTIQDHDDQYDGYCLIADYLPFLRPSLTSFPSQNAYLKADHARINHWRAWLDSLGNGPKIGILWKSFKTDAIRGHLYAPLADWMALKDIEGAHFIELQYGDKDADLDWARQQGFEITTPPELNLKDDLDGISALLCALDALIGPSTATINLGAALGMPTYIEAPHPYWIFLGQDRHPFYPSAKIFVSKTDEPQIMRFDRMKRALSFGLGVDINKGFGDETL